MRNINIRNFGLGNRCTKRALFNAYKETVHSFSSEAVAKVATAKFATYIREAFSIKDLRYIKKSHVKAYANLLLEQYENDQISLSTAKNYLSIVNRALSNARLDEACQISPVKDAGFPNSSGIAIVSKAADLLSHEQAKKAVSPRLSAQIDLQRNFGLRFKESSLIDSITAKKQALELGYIILVYGTKGGRSRRIPITNESQIVALNVASDIQGTNSSLIPSHLSWAQYQDLCYREVSNLHDYNFHSERHYYAQSRYLSLTGVKCPVSLRMNKKSHAKFLAWKKGVSLEVAAQIDKRARSLIANELGHSRTSITSAYLG